MSSRPKTLLTMLIVVLTIVSSLQAQGTPAGDTTNLPEVPYIAEAIGNNIYLRSGAAVVFYFCGKVHSPAKVKVVNHLHGWSEVIPPEGSFSWISKEYVDISKLNPNVGLVNGNGVRVWAGSDYIEPMRSTSLQVKLNKGDIVKLIDPGLQKSDYYRIVPPPGAHLWISSEFLRYVGPLPRPIPTISKMPTNTTVEPTIIEKPTETEVSKPTIIEKPTETEVTKPTIVEKPGETDITNPFTFNNTTTANDTSVTNVTTPEKPSEAARIKQCYEIAERIREELAKPVEVQDYTLLTKELEEIANDPDAGKAQRYAEYQTERIKRFMLAKKAGDDLLKQDAELEKIRAQIRQRMADKIAGVPDPGRHIIKGQIKPSLVFTAQAGQKRYKILNDAGRIVCYAMPAPKAAAIDLSDYMDKKVGLKGTMISDKINPVGLVMFTEIEEIAGTDQSGVTPQAVPEKATPVETTEARKTEKTEVAATAGE